jgi:hypothetical protein
LNVIQNISMTEFYFQIKFQLGGQAHAEPVHDGSNFALNFLIRCNVKTASEVKQFFDLSGQRGRKSKLGLACFDSKVAFNDG